MITDEQKKIVSQNLKQCDNLGDMFTYLQNTFDLKKCKPGPIAKASYIGGVMKAIDILKPELK